MEARRPDLAPLPSPPADQATRTVPIALQDRSWYRIHPCVHGALSFNRQPVARFNAPVGQYGILYAGSDVACCFVETFGWPDAKADVTVRTISKAQLLASCLSEIVPMRPLVLVDLTGPWLRRLDADALLLAGDQAEARLWGRAFWTHPEQPDGLLFPARHDPSLPSLALFDRAQGAVKVGKSLSLGNLSLSALGALLDRFDFSLRP